MYLWKIDTKTKEDFTEKKTTKLSNECVGQGHQQMPDSVKPISSEKKNGEIVPQKKRESDMRWRPTP